MDDLIFRQLKGTGYHHPEVTEVIFDVNQMFEMSLHSVNISEKGYDIVWDKVMIDFLRKYFKEGLQLLEDLADKRGLRRRLIAETTPDNIEFVNSLSYSEIRHLDSLRGNFGIFDERAYIVQIFHKDTEKPDQAFWSNSITLVRKQQALFNDLWEMAIPLSARNRELTYHVNPEYRKTFTDYHRIHQEVKSILEQCRNEVSIFVSFNILQRVFDDKDWIKSISTLLARGVNIRILTDDIDDESASRIIRLQNENKSKPIQFGFSNKLGNFNELVILSDDKYALQIKYNEQNKLTASFTNEESRVMVQEILFEKYWNEIKSLEVIESR